MNTSELIQSRYGNRLTLTEREFRRATGMGRDAIYAAIHARKIRIIRSGRRFLIPCGELERILREGLE